MPKLKTNYLELHQRVENIKAFAIQWFAVASISSSSYGKDVARFGKFNQITLRRLSKKEEQLFALYVQVDTEGNYIYNPTPPRPEMQAITFGGRMPLYKDLESSVKFSEEWKELMDTECIIEL